MKNMKMNKPLVLGISLILLALVIFAVMKKTSSGYENLSSWDIEGSSDGGGGGGGSSWKLYGSDKCGWTTKQKKEMDSKNVSYTFVDCDKESCDGITSFPTLKNSDGTVKVGFTPM